MRADHLLRPPVPRGAYPEREERQEKYLERLYGRSARFAFCRAKMVPWRVRRLVKSVERHGSSFVDLKPAEIRKEADELRQYLRDGGLRDELVARCYALVREVASRALKERHYDVQLIGGWALLHGMVAEMETGEGKTLTATLPACTMALAGVPVHVITVNDYLARRDANWMGPIYEGLGLKVGVIVHGMAHEAKREAYAADVTYCTNKEVAFDYLRDRIVLGGNPSRLHLQVEQLCGGLTRVGRLILRGLHYGIVDEADSVLIDEARTPLIISRSESAEEERRTYETALELAGHLKAGRHYSVDRQERRVELLGAGKGRLEELGRSKGGVWARRRLREEMIHQALSARHLFFRDKHYLIKDGKVQIIDEYTGRTMPDRSWEHGLHQAIEAKESCPITPQNHPVARISYQRFFRRYLRLAGMTGTAREVAGELGEVYGLPVVKVPTNRPLHRVSQPDRIYRTAEAKWKAVVERVQEIHSSGRPLLIGTRSVEASERLSDLLTAAALPHQVLNARQDKGEAEIIARAGERGWITVATNMAGRGTDIRLAPGVAELGGLHVIATERHDARRIDRQLFGRCGRQGDPGTFEAIVSLEDELISSHAGKLKRLFFLGKGAREPVAPRRAAMVCRHAQRRAERLHWHMRRELLRMDEYLETALAFSGMPE